MPRLTSYKMATYLPSLWSLALFGAGNDHYVTDNVCAHQFALLPVGYFALDPMLGGSRPSAIRAGTFKPHTAGGACCEPPPLLLTCQ